MFDRLELNGYCLASLSRETQLPFCQSGDQGVVDIIQPNFHSRADGQSSRTDERQSVEVGCYLEQVCSWSRATALLVPDARGAGLLEQWSTTVH